MSLPQLSYSVSGILYTLHKKSQKTEEDTLLQEVPKSVMKMMKNVKDKMKYLKHEHCQNSTNCGLVHPYLPPEAIKARSVSSLSLMEGHFTSRKGEVIF